MNEKDRKDQKDYQNKLQFFMQVATVVIILLNLWLANKLAPMAQDIALIKGQVMAIERNQSNFVTNTELDLVCQMVSEIKRGVDDLIKMHLK